MMRGNCTGAPELSWSSPHHSRRPHAGLGAYELLLPPSEGLTTPSGDAARRSTVAAGGHLTCTATMSLRGMSPFLERKLRTDDSHSDADRFTCLLTTLRECAAMGAGAVRDCVKAGPGLLWL